MEPQAKKSRKPNWTEEQNLLLTRLVESNKALLLGKFGPGITAQRKRDKWADICQEINSTFPNVTRSVEEVEKKWHNIQAKAKSDICNFKKSTITTGGGPSCPPLSTLSEVVRDILGNDNMVISGVPNSTDSSMLQVLEVPSSIEDTSSNMTDYDLRTLQALSGIQVPPTVSVSRTPQPVCITTPASTAPSNSVQQSLCPQCQDSVKIQSDLNIEKLKLEIEILKIRKALLLQEVKKTGEE